MKYRNIILIFLFSFQISCTSNNYISIYDYIKPITKIYLLEPNKIIMIDGNIAEVREEKKDYYVSWHNPTSTKFMNIRFVCSNSEKMNSIINHIASILNLKLSDFQNNSVSMQKGEYKITIEFGESPWDTFDIDYIITKIN